MTKRIGRSKPRPKAPAAPPRSVPTPNARAAASEADRHGDARAVEEAGEDVAPEVVGPEEVDAVGRPQARLQVRRVRVERDESRHAHGRGRSGRRPAPREERGEERDEREEPQDEESPPRGARVPHGSSPSTIRGSERAAAASAASVATTTARPETSVRPRTVGRSREKTESARSCPVPGTPKTRLHEDGARDELRDERRAEPGERGDGPTQGPQGLLAGRLAPGAPRERRGRRERRPHGRPGDARDRREGDEGERDDGKGDSPAGRATGPRRPVSTPASRRRGGGGGGRARSSAGRRGRPGRFPRRGPARPGVFGPRPRRAGPRGPRRGRARGRSPRASRGASRRSAGSPGDRRGTTGRGRAARPKRAR